jgi:hypothetical protein
VTKDTRQTMTIMLVVLSIIGAAAGSIAFFLICVDRLFYPGWLVVGIAFCVLVAVVSAAHLEEYR